MGLAAGTKLGHHEIQELSGQGGMGEVYRAHDSKLERDVAIKVLPSHLAANAEAREQRRYRWKSRLIGKDSQGF